ncbi:MULTISPECIES: hypothetical protein [Thalassospira]|uniref:hypothetical protein n=1 Tax=Thalassospira TaxID=168934 RepID=UPI000DEE0FA3|nr:MULTISPECIES: hypothetical protein [Thalassospira]MCK2166209.1 hypothetical protein [Thalassospira xiamenensis]RCK31846.1 hypothetical protein TH9_14100 [Thalassospira xiamenensis]WOI09706.1 hypothetical protein R1T41_14340 [Thalassospira lucentensis]
MTYRPPTKAQDFDIRTDPIANRVPFGRLIDKITNYSADARKRKNEREVMAHLSDDQLRDVGLQRTFDGHQWRVTRIV